MDHEDFCYASDKVKIIVVKKGLIYCEFSPDYRVAYTDKQSSWCCITWIELRSIIEGLQKRST